MLSIIPHQLVPGDIWWVLCLSAVTERMSYLMDVSSCSLLWSPLSAGTSLQMAPVLGCLTGLLYCAWLLFFSTACNLPWRSQEPKEQVFLPAGFWSVCRRAWPLDWKWPWVFWQALCALCLGVVGGGKPVERPPFFLVSEYLPAESLKMVMKSRRNIVGELLPAQGGSWGGRCGGTETWKAEEHRRRGCCQPLGSCGGRWRGRARECWAPRRAVQIRGRKEYYSQQQHKWILFSKWVFVFKVSKCQAVALEPEDLLGILNIPM